MCESLNEIDQLLITQIGAVPGVVGSVFDGRALWSVAVLDLLLPQAASCEDIPLRHPPRQFKSASNSHLITVTQIT